MWMKDSKPEDWREANRQCWDEKVGLHLGTPDYDLTPLREGRAVLHPVEQAELGDVAGLKIAHLQCHFGRDSLTLAQQGAEVVGLDFSGEAVRTATALAEELGLSDRARFVQSDVYDAATALAGEAPFDMVFSSWGAIGWLPDLEPWGKVIASLLKPGGRFYFAEGHPFAMVFDEEAGMQGDRPGWFEPYFNRLPYRDDAPRDYTEAAPELSSDHLYWWSHTLGDVMGALLGAGLRLDFFHEHDQIPWRAFSTLTERPGGMYGWPDKPWLPLAMSMQLTRI